MFKYFRFVLFLLPLSGWAKQFYVSSADELLRVLKKVGPGDVVVWRNGDYANQHIEFSPFQNGKKDNPIKLMAEKPGKVRFFGNSYLAMAGEYLEVEGFLFEGSCALSEKDHVIRFSTGDAQKQIANYCRVTQCAIIDYTLPEESGISNYYVSLEGTHNELDHCYFKGKTNKGPTVVVNYLQEDGYESGSDLSPSTFHHIHHNYFGYRTFSSNGGEQIRVGVSTTSGTKGFNLIESNFFEDTRIEAEVISNKSGHNIYRYNVLFNNDGALVLRHGTDCLVYGNYVNGQSGRGQSGGIRIINPRQTVFNNLIENVEGSKIPFKGPVVVMSGFKGAEVNEYSPADEAIIAFNVIRNSVGPAIKVGVCNTGKGKECQSPKNIKVEGNVVIDVEDELAEILHYDDTLSVVQGLNNYYAGNMDISQTVFIKVAKNEAVQLLANVEKAKIQFAEVINDINKRAETFSLKLKVEDIIHFNADKIPSRREVGAEWLIQY